MSISRPVPFTVEDYKSLTASSDQRYELIDGTQQVKAHGTGAMPIWSADYIVKGSEYYVDVPCNAAIYVRSRILARTEYVYRLQAK